MCSIIRQTLTRMKNIEGALAPLAPWFLHLCEVHVHMYDMRLCTYVSLLCSIRGITEPPCDVRSYVCVEVHRRSF